MLEELDPQQLLELHQNVVCARDAVAEMINRIEADPPGIPEEYVSTKTRLMNGWRDLSILRVQVAYAGRLG